MDKKTGAGGGGWGAVGRSGLGGGGGGGIVTVEKIKCIAKSNNILNMNRYV